MWRLLLLMMGACSALVHWPHESGKYHNHATTINFMKQLDQQYPKLVRLYSIGHSTNELELLVMELTSPTLVDETRAVPKHSVHLIGSVYGDEPVGRELLLNLAYWLVTSYSEDAKQGPHLLDLLRVHILPVMNPDGSEVSREGTCFLGLGKRNLNGIPLDGDFPMMNVTDDSFPHTPQVETAAVMKWMAKAPAVLCFTLRGGSHAVAYPYETRRNKDDASANVSPDDDVLQSLARVVADNNPLIKNATICTLNGREYLGGVVNGAMWRKKVGGIQDYVYKNTGAMHLNIGVTCCKHPVKTDIPKLWRENQAALLALLAEATGGLDGVVRDATSHEAISGARLNIAGRSSVPFYSANLKGTFSRLLLPGVYNLEVSKKGYKSTSLVVNINKERKIHLLGREVTVHEGFVEVLLHIFNESEPLQPRLVQHRYEVKTNEPTTSSVEHVSTTSQSNPTSKHPKPHGLIAVTTTTAPDKHKSSSSTPSPSYCLVVFLIVSIQYQ